MKKYLLLVTVLMGSFSVLVGKCEKDCKKLCENYDQGYNSCMHWCKQCPKDK